MRLWARRVKQHLAGRTKLNSSTAQPLTYKAYVKKRRPYNLTVIFSMSAAPFMASVRICLPQWITDDWLLRGNAYVLGRSGSQT